MLTLELWTKNNHGIRTYHGTYGKSWKTMRGIENFRDRLIEKHGYTLDDFRINGEESRKASPASINAFTVGNVLHSVYGYDMVVNSYYEVVEVSASGKTVKIRPLRKLYDASPNDIAGCRAFPDLTSEERFTGDMEAHRVLASWDGKPYVRLSSYEVASLLDLKDAVYGSMEDHND